MCIRSFSLRICLRWVTTPLTLVGALLLVIWQYGGFFTVQYTGIQVFATMAIPLLYQHVWMRYDRKRLISDARQAWSIATDTVQENTHHAGMHNKLAGQIGEWRTAFQLLAEHIEHLARIQGTEVIPHFVPVTRATNAIKVLKILIPGVKSSAPVSDFPPRRALTGEEMVEVFRFLAAYQSLSALSLFEDNMAVIAKRDEFIQFLTNLLNKDRPPEGIKVG